MLPTAMRAESKAYIGQDVERQQAEYENIGRTNEAIKTSMDQLNGRAETRNGGNNGLPPPPPPTVPSNQAPIETISHHQQQHNIAQIPQHHPVMAAPHQIPPFHLQEKKNTDV